MPKYFPHFFPLTLLVLLLMLGGCNISSHSNQDIPTSTTSLGSPSKGSTPTEQTSILETEPVGLETTTPSFCYEVPEPELIKPSDISNNVYLSGTFYLCWYTKNSFDMDNGILGHVDSFGNMDTTLTDVEFSVRASTLDSSNIGYFILGANGAYVTNSDKETIEHCQNGIVTPPPDSGIIFGESGVSTCVLTNEGRLGYMNIERVNPLGTESLKITFITWKKK